MASAEELNRMKARAEQTDKILAELQGQIEAIKKAAGLSSAERRKHINETVSVIYYLNIHITGISTTYYCKPCLTSQTASRKKKHPIFKFKCVLKPYQ